MKKFVFKLETALKYRELLEDIAKNEYREALSTLNRGMEELTSLIKRREQVYTDFKRDEGVVISSDEYMLMEMAGGQLKVLIRRQDAEVVRLRHTAQDKLKNWQDKRKDAEIIRKLKEKKKKEHKLMLEKEEQSFLDELFIGKTIREGALNEE